jgi:hypothetical protein
VANTKHRQYQSDRSSPYDETEQQMMVRDYRKQRAECVMDIEDDEDLKECGHYQDIAYFLSRYK